MGDWLWKDIDIKLENLGETIVKGKNMWAKDYTYIFLPKGYGYDNYCFLLSDKCVHISSDKKSAYISICATMNIDLIYNPKLREEDKKYQRHKLTGEELFDRVYCDYEKTIIADSIKRQKKEKEERIKRYKRTKGKIICGKYTGNAYGNLDGKYRCQRYYSSFFKGDDFTTYSNSKFDKVHNVEELYTIIDNVSRYEYIQSEEIINAYIREMEMLREMKIAIDTHLEKKHNFNLPKTERSLYRVVTKTDSILKEQSEMLDVAIEKIKEEMLQRIDTLRKNWID